MKVSLWVQLLGKINNINVLFYHAHGNNAKETWPSQHPQKVIGASCKMYSLIFFLAFNKNN
jgi:hypothetical protein